MNPRPLRPRGGQESTYSQDFDLIFSRPHAPRQKAGFSVGDRVADFRRFLAFWIDLVEDPDLAARSDPRSYIRMFRDPQIHACHTIRTYATACLPWHLTPADESAEARKYADKVDRFFKELPHFAYFIKNLMLAIPFGSSFTEIVWNVNEAMEIYPYKTFPVHKDRFTFDLDGNLALKSPRQIFWGEYVPEHTFLHHIFDMMPGSFVNPLEEGRLFFGFGLHDVLYPTYYAKQILLRLDLRYLNRYANPIREGRYPSKSVEGQDAVQSLFDDMAHESMILFPSDEGYDVNLHELSGVGHGSFQSMIDYFDRQISKVYLGSTLLLDVGDVGAYSLGRVHERTTFGRIAEYDHQSVSSVINSQLIESIFALNRWPKHLKPEFTFTLKESHDIGEVLEAMRVAQSMGYPLSVEMLSEQTGIRTPREGETILTVSPDEDGVSVEQKQGVGGPNLMSGPGREEYVQQNRDQLREIQSLRVKLDQLGTQILGLSANKLIA